MKKSLEKLTLAKNKLHHPMTSPPRHAEIYQFLLFFPTNLAQYSLFPSHQLFIFLYYIHLHTKKRSNGIYWEHYIAFSRQHSAKEARVTSLRPAHTGKRKNNVPHHWPYLAQAVGFPSELLVQEGWAKEGKWINERILPPKRGHKYDFILWFQDMWPSQVMARRSFHRKDS